MHANRFRAGAIVAGAIIVAALTGCSAVGGLIGKTANPVVQGQISVASREQCRSYAVGHQADARATADLLLSVSTAADACIAGINDAEPEPTAAPE